MGPQSSESLIFYPLINALQVIFFAVWSVIWMSFAMMASFFSEEVPLIMARRCWAPPILFICGVRLKVDGLEHLRADTPYVYVMNHQSMIDIAVAIAVIPENLRFVGKGSLLRVPFLGGYIRRVQYITIDRSRREDAYAKLREAAHVVSSGRSFLLYPEGTRSNDGTVKKFKRGPFVLAQAAGVSVVPVAIDGAGEVLATGTVRVRPGTIHVRFGAPISSEGAPDDPEAIDRLRVEVHGAVSKLFGALRALSSGRP